MASYDVDAYGAEVRVRDMGFVILLHTVTLGLYNPYWYYKINRELRDFGRIYKLERCAACNPWLALAAVTVLPVAIVVGAIGIGAAARAADSVNSSSQTLAASEVIILVGFLTAFVAPIVSWHRATKRIQEAQTVVDQQPISGVAIGFSYAGGVLLTPIWLLIPYLVQSALNDVWSSYRGIDSHTRRSPERINISVGALESLPDAKRWDLSELDRADIESIEGFLGQREDLSTKARSHYATELEGRIRPLVPDAPAELEAERLLELAFAAADAADLVQGEDPRQPLDG